MNFKLVGAVILSVSVLPAFADDVVTSTTTAASSSTTVINATTLSAAAIISPGRYMTTVAPNFDRAMADRLKAAFKAVPGLDNPQVRLEDSTIHFTVKEGTRIRVADIQKIVAQTDRSAVMTAPILENSESPTPGL